MCSSDLGAQAEGCSPIAQAFAEGRDFITPVKPNTIAKSLAIGNPADGYYAYRAVKDSGGYGEQVKDPEQMLPALERAMKAVMVDKRQALLNVVCPH